MDSTAPSKPNADHSLRRLEIASLLWNAGEQVYLIGLLVFAYRAGGPSAVALLGLIQAAPAVFLVPPLLRATEHARGERLLEIAIGIRAGSIALAALSLAGGAPAAVFGFATIDALAASVARPSRSALSPRLARSTSELVRSNVRISGGRSAAGLVGPAVAAFLLVQGDVSDTLWLGAAMFAAAFAVVVDLRASAPLPSIGTDDADRSGGLRTLLSMREPRAVVAVLAGQQAVRGMMPVLLVSFAVEILRAGDPGVGILNAATGAGGLLGGAIALVVAHRSRLPAAFAAGTAVWGVALVVPGLLPTLVATVLALVVGGMGRAVVEVTGVTLLQRAIPVGQRRRVFAVVESIVTLAMAVGAVVGAGLVALARPGGALVVAGGLVVVLAVVTWPIVRIADARMPVPEADIRLLRSVPMFRPLSLSTTEEIAAAVRHVEVAAGTDVVRQGEHGDRFYIIESGRLEVIVDGSPILGELGPGESFGEIALIRDVPRTATVRAIATSRLSAIDRGNFLAAVSGRQDAAAAAEEVIRGRLGA